MLVQASTCTFCRNQYGPLPSCMNHEKKKSMVMMQAGHMRIIRRGMARSDFGTLLAFSLRATKARKKPPRRKKTSTERRPASATRKQVCLEMSRTLDVLMMRAKKQKMQVCPKMTHIMDMARTPSRMLRGSLGRTWKCFMLAMRSKELTSLLVVVLRAEGGESLCLRVEQRVRRTKRERRIRVRQETQVRGKDQGQVYELTAQILRGKPALTIVWLSCLLMSSSGQALGMHSPVNTLAQVPLIPNCTKLYLRSGWSMQSSQWPLWKKARPVSWRRVEKWWAMAVVQFVIYAERLKVQPKHEHDYECFFIWDKFQGMESGYDQGLTRNSRSKVGLCLMAMCITISMAYLNSFIGIRPIIVTNGAHIQENLPQPCLPPGHQRPRPRGAPGGPHLRPPGDLPAEARGAQEQGVPLPADPLHQGQLPGRQRVPHRRGGHAPVRALPDPRHAHDQLQAGATVGEGLRSDGGLLEEPPERGEQGPEPEEREGASEKEDGYPEEEAEEAVMCVCVAKPELLWHVTFGQNMKSGKYNGSVFLHGMEGIQGEVKRVLQIDLKAMKFTFFMSFSKDTHSLKPDTDYIEMEGSLKEQGNKLTAVVKKGSQHKTNCLNAVEGTHQTNGIKGRIVFGLRRVDDIGNEPVPVLQVEKSRLEGEFRDPRYGILGHLQQFFKI